MRRSSIAFVLPLLSFASPAFAQGTPPQLPPPAPQPPPAQYQPPPQPYDEQPPGAYGQQSPQPYYQSQQQVPPREAPPAFAYVEPEPPTHAPKFSLWAGGRLSYLGFGFGFYENPDGRSETTGNLIGNGLAPELDVGARISYRYIPYLFWEHGFMLAGHRFDGAQGASASTDFYGVGFRILNGDADSVAFVSDLSIGKRVITLKNGGESYSMSGLEYFRLGLGAEIRVTTLFTIDPLLSISTGSLNDTEGTVSYAPNQGDGSTSPPFKGGQTIEQPRAYVMLSLGVGVHFDFFGK
jgi:hypothetical protein